MSKKITQKLKGLLTPEDLKIFEGAVESFISDKVTEKLGTLVALKEEELKAKYDTIAEKYVADEVAKRIEKEKASIMESYDKKLTMLDKKIVSKLDSFLEHVIVEQISDEMLEKMALNETLSPVIDGIKSIFAKNHIELDSEGENIVKDITESKEKAETDLSESIAKNMELEERLEKSAVFLMISENTNGLTETQKNKVLTMFKDKKFDEVDKKIGDFVTLIKEGDSKKTEVNNEDTKTVEDIISEGDGLDDPKKTVIVEEIVDEVTKLTDNANKYMYEQ